MKIKIKSFNGELPSYLTVGKVYILDNIMDMDGGYIYADDNNKHYIALNECAYLNGGSWEIVSE